MGKSELSSGGIGFFGLLIIVFIVLKLTDYIDWSWWWVFSPIWIPIVIIIFVLLIIGVILIINRLLNRVK